VKRANMRLPHGETDERKRYSLPDPDALSEHYEKAYDAVYYRGRPLGDASPVTLDKDDAAALLILARGYLDLTTYELGQECCVEKLRDVWRARRAR